MYLIIIAVVEKVDERRLIKVEMEILGELQANDMDRIENQATIKINEIVEEPQTELLDQCRDDCRDRNCLVTNSHD